MRGMGDRLWERFEAPDDCVGGEGGVGVEAKYLLEVEPGGVEARGLCQFHHKGGEGALGRLAYVGWYTSQWGWG